MLATTYIFCWKRHSVCHVGSIISTKLSSSALQAPAKDKATYFEQLKPSLNVVIITIIKKEN